MRMLQSHYVLGSLDIERGFFGVRLDERFASGYVGAHEHIEDLIGILGVFDIDLLQDSPRWIHGRLP